MNAYLTTRETGQTISADSLPDNALFRGMTERHRKIMAECSSRATYGEGESIVEAGSSTKCFFLVISGSIGLVTPGAHASSPPRTVGTGEILGWSWLFPPASWQFDAIAIEPTEVILFNATALCQKCNRDHGLGFELFMRLAQRRSRGDTNQLTKKKDNARYTPLLEKRGDASFSGVSSRASDVVACYTQKQKLSHPVQNHSGHRWPHVLLDSARIVVKSLLTGLPHETVSDPAE